MYLRTEAGIDNANLGRFTALKPPSTHSAIPAPDRPVVNYFASCLALCFSPHLLLPGPLCLGHLAGSLYCCMRPLLLD